MHTLTLKPKSAHTYTHIHAFYMHCNKGYKRRLISIPKLPTLKFRHVCMPI